MSDPAAVGPEFRGYAVLLWAIKESDRIDDLAGIARTIRGCYADDTRLPELLRKIDDRAGELLIGGGGRRRTARTTPPGTYLGAAAVPEAVAIRLPPGGH